MRCPKCGGYNFDREDRCLDCGYSVPSQKAPAWWAGKDFQGLDKAPDHDRNGQEEHHDGQVDRSGPSLSEFRVCPHCKTLSLFRNQQTLMYECLNPDCGRTISATEYDTSRGEATAPQERDKPEKVASPVQGEEGKDKERESTDRAQVHECPACRQTPLYWNSLNRQYECHNPTCRRDFAESEYEQLKGRQQPYEEEAPKKEQSSEILETCPECGQEMYDVVDLTDAVAGLTAAKKRVLSLSHTYNPTKGQYILKIGLGAV